MRASSVGTTSRIKPAPWNSEDRGVAAPVHRGARKGSNSRAPASVARGPARLPYRFAASERTTAFAPRSVNTTPMSPDGPASASPPS